MSAFFYIPVRFHTLSSPLHSFLASLIADCNSSHKLLTQLQTLTNFSKEPGLAMLQLTLKVFWMLAHTKSFLINTLKVLAPLRVFISRIFKVSHYS